MPAPVVVTRLPPVTAPAAVERAARILALGVRRALGKGAAKAGP